MIRKLRRNSARKLAATTIAALGLLLSACDSAVLTCQPAKQDCSAPSADLPNIIDVATNSGQFSTLLTALDAAGLTQVLADPAGIYTVFAPTDAAFTALGDDAVAALLADGTALTDTLLNHVISGYVNAETATTIANTADGNVINMENGKPATLTVVDGQLQINGVSITQADILTSNGVIHVIDTVLTPADGTVTPDPQTFTDVLASDPDLSTLVTALETSGLDATLNDADSVTIFAPNNDAFDALGSDAVNALLADAEGLQDLLQYHTVPGTIDAATATSLAGGDPVTMQNGDQASLTLAGEQLLINGVAISQADIPAPNGIIHVIDGVLTTPTDTPPSPGNIIKVLEGQSDYSFLLSAITANGLIATLEDSAVEYTVFAPNNAAFEAAETELNAGYTSDPAAMMDLLKGHVVPNQKITAADAVDGTSVTMANSGNRSISVANGVITIDGAKIIEADLPASNGVIHGIDAVLLPTAAP